jgi:serine/threonine protein kinase
MSPEQAAGRAELSEATDIYSLACVVFEMLIGEPPGMRVTEEAGGLRRFVDAPAKQRLKLDALPGSLESALVYAMRLRPEERYATANEFAQALEAALSAPKIFDEDEAQRIVRRAADLEARPSRRRETALSLGGVERLAAEVGIAPALVRERTIDVEVSGSTYGILLEEVRDNVGLPGQINETLVNRRGQVNPDLSDEVPMTSNQTIQGVSPLAFETPYPS